jgi:hypothetical protein
MTARIVEFEPGNGSALTQVVKVIEAPKVSIHAAFLKVTSGQLPFQG